MFLAKGYFRVGRILSIFWITLLSTLALSILFFSPSANASSLDNFIADNNTTLAFNLDNAAPNEMTPEMSKEIYEDSQKSKKETTDNVDSNISENSATETDGSDSDSNLSERKKAEKNTSSLDQEKSEKTPNLVFAISIISSVILVATPTLLIVKRHRSAHKQKTLKPNNTKNKIVK